MLAPLPTLQMLPSSIKLNPFRVVLYAHDIPLLGIASITNSQMLPALSKLNPFRVVLYAQGHTINRHSIQNTPGGEIFC
jgi:hypothetical protein